MTTQQKFWSDIGPTLDDGGTSQTLLPTPTRSDVGRTEFNAKNREIQGHQIDLSTIVHLPSMSSVAASPASLFQWLEPDAGRVMSVGCGTSFAKLYESSDRDTLWLKTSQDCSVQRMLLDDGGDCLEEFCETWPRWGMMLNGVAYRQPPLVCRISATESSSWLTKDGLLTTPRSNEWKDCGDPGSKSHAHMKERQYLSATVKTTGGLLNPQFVEAMMGLPIGWTELNVSETQSSPKSPPGSER